MNKPAQQHMTQKGRTAFDLSSLPALCAAPVDFIHRHESCPTSLGADFFGSDWDSGNSIRGEAPLVANG